MFFLPAAIFAGVDGITWWTAIHNWIFAFLGNLVGAGVFVAGGYYYLYGREPDAVEPGDTSGDGAGDGRTARDRASVTTS
jgi:hypothetical protein